MKLDTKVTTFSIVMTVVMIVVIVVVSFLSFRQFTISTEREHIRSVAEIVRISLNESLMHIEKEKRVDFLGHLATVEGLHQARVVRSDSVSKQFGKGSELEQIKDEIEARVIQDGQPYYKLMDEMTRWFYVARCLT